MKLTVKMAAELLRWYGFKPVGCEEDGYRFMRHPDGRQFFLLDDVAVCHSRGNKEEGYMFKTREDLSEFLTTGILPLADGERARMLNH